MAWLVPICAGGEEAKTTMRKSGPHASTQQLTQDAYGADLS